MQGLVYRKTRKGYDEIEGGGSSIKRKLRSALILVDGHSAFPDLVRKISVMGDAEEIVLQLLEHGLIEPIPGAEAETVEPQPVQVAVVVSSKEASERAGVGGNKDIATVRCPLHKPVCAGADCTMSYGCTAKFAFQRHRP